ncbi:MAG: hypothetical protein VKL39_14795 [Leptolyngbyaceae bacterium]|nr:hypothetical protein [Leptolyngbyaceae bacterium]
MKDFMNSLDQTLLRKLNEISDTLSKNCRLNALILIEKLLEGHRYQSNKRLERYGFKSYSQSDEDGILQEIFRRIGIEHHAFVEFGVGNGLENNTTYLLYQKWHGLWIEGSTDFCQSIRSKFKIPIDSGQLKLVNQFVSCENIDRLICECGFGREIDLLSIDLDGNDYHVWQTISSVSPRVVTIEYNGKFRPPVEYVMKYNPVHQWDGTDQFGASLKSLELLGQAKGYCLVGCNLTGVNAFFVRQDLCGDHFYSPATSEDLYNPPRYDLVAAYAHLGGHAANFPQ